MRKIALAFLAPAAVIVLAAPAGAALPVDRPVHSSQSAWASWYTREPLSATSWRETSYYLSAYTSNHGTFVSLSRGIFTCTESAGTTPREPSPKPVPRPYDCTGTWADGSAEGGFVMDGRLTDASVKGVVPLQAWDENGTQVGGPVPTTVVARWMENGRLDRHNYHSSFCDGLHCFVEVYTSSYRPSTASSTIGDVTLGDTGDASMSSDRSIFIAS